jgi:uncharacterized membrane protein YeaQ/YmgE (transglycosylase-associated protein family)
MYTMLLDAPTSEARAARAAQARDRGFRGGFSLQLPAPTESDSMIWRTAPRWTFWFLLSASARAGWPAILKGGYGLAGNLTVGVNGAILGGFLFRIIGLAATGLQGQLVMAVVGSVVLILLLRLGRRHR